MNARDNSFKRLLPHLPEFEGTRYLAGGDADTRAREMAAGAKNAGSYVSDVLEVAAMHAATSQKNAVALTRSQVESAKALAGVLQSQKPGDLAEYLTDAGQRWLLFMDVMRRRGNSFIEHEKEGSKPVLAYDYDVVVDGSKLEQPVNYSLVSIHPPPGVTVRPEARPYVIIDPRAGHGSGIGGFKSESEVGCALRAGHPVYFCIFTTYPTPTQTLADVTRAEAQFVREVQRRHPLSPKPVIIGNCQGGWGAMLLAATNPDLAGPLVINGAPLSYWAGTRGKNPMRYLGGLFGGIVPALVACDLGNGRFDGASLVANFEALNPGNSLFRKYYDVFADVEREGDRFLHFERWWSGFYFMNREEMKWLIENLFVGNKLGRGGAQLDSRMHVDLRNIRAPIVVFASHGDNITPPAQALNWITDLYSSVQDIRARGQRIVYTIHDTIGHLGIFVGSSVAKKQHKEIVETLKAIESLPPGLYEMKIVDEVGEGDHKQYTVSFEARTLKDVQALDDGRDDEQAFAAVSRLSRLNAELYDLFARPALRALSNANTARFNSDAMPIRAQRFAMSDLNPAMSQVASLAQAAKSYRKKAAADNPFAQWERTMADLTTQWLDAATDLRDGWVETWFYATYGTPLMRALGAGEPKRMSEVPGTDLRAVPEVRAALAQITRGNFAVAVIRMLVLFALSRGSVRREGLERANQMLTTQEPFAALGEETRTRIMHQQSLIVEFELEQAIATLPKLLPTHEDRLKALALCEQVGGDPETMPKDTREMLQRIRQVLEVHEEAPKQRARPPQVPAAA
jgi:pimeloyl-ACP methyl ester carboxylesterase